MSEVLSPYLVGGLVVLGVIVLIRLNRYLDWGMWRHVPWGVRRKSGFTCPDCSHSETVKWHSDCVSCTARTCRRSAWVTPTSLKRAISYVCGECAASPKVQEQQRTMRRRRVENDWRTLSTPVDRGTLAAGILEEQYPGLTRSALRAFMDSDAESALIPGVSAATLESAIGVLGLKHVYAEQRSGQTFLRKYPVGVEVPEYEETAVD